MGGALDQLAEAVESLELPPEAGALEKALALIDRLQAKVALALGDFDAREGWAPDGALSLTAWLSHHGRRSRRAAHREAGTAKALRQLPDTARAWEEGDLSAGQVEAVMANVSEDRLSLYGDHQASLLPTLSPLTVGQTARVMRSWRLHADALAEGSVSSDPPSMLRFSETLDGRRELSGHLGPEDAEVVEQALSLATNPEADGEPRRAPAVRRAEALVDVCRWFLSHHLAEPGGALRRRPQVSVIVELEHLLAGGPGRLEEGTPLDAVTLARLLCDAEIHRVVRRGRSQILDYGTTTRTISPPLWAALVIRDGGCRHPGCDRGPGWCEAHHVIPWARGGPTRAENLALGCTRHHHYWHQLCQAGGGVTLEDDGTLVIGHPDGRVFRSRPPPRPPGLAV